MSADEQTTRGTLSVCCLASSPGPFLLAALGPVAEIADEVVIAAGGDLSAEDLACYGELADKLFSIEFRFVERHLAWLHAQCSCDWILRLDGDEIPSAEMLQAVVAARDDRDLAGVHFSRRQLYPTVASYLSQEPWFPDFQLRMVRRDGALRFSGLTHSSAERADPARFVEAPLYHLTFIASGPESRRRRAADYETLRSGLTTPTGLRAEAMLVPEDLGPVQTRATPDADREMLERALNADRRSGSRADAVRIGLPETDSAWAGRTLDESAYRASVSSIVGEVPMSPGEQRPIYLRVLNEGTETWPWDPSIGPFVHLVYRWLDHDGGPLEAWRPAFFTEWVRPGAATIVPLLVLAPSREGHYILTARIRHAPERVFGSPCEMAVQVRPGGAWGD